MPIQRNKRLSKEDDLTAKNVEQIFQEFDTAIPKPEDYRRNVVEKLSPGLVVPRGMGSGEIRVDASGSTKKLIVNIGGELYYVDLTKVT